MSWLPAQQFANWLCSVLRKYLSNVNEQSVQIGLWNGDLVLKGLTVRKDAFKRLRIPILVRRGHVGLVHLQVPWKSFGSGTLRFELRDVYIALEPIGSCLYDEETEIIVQRIIRSHKQAVIAEMESALYKGPKKKESRLLRVLQGVTGLFMSRALRSAHLEVSNVHVVWCSGDWDSQVDGNEANVAIGTYLGSLKVYPHLGSLLPSSKTMVTTNNSSSSASTVGKTIEILQLSAYMRPRAVGDNSDIGPMWPDNEHGPSVLTENTILSADRIDGSLSVHPNREKVQDAADPSTTRGSGSSFHDSKPNIPQILPLAEFHLTTKKIHCQASEMQCMTLSTALAEVARAKQLSKFRRLRPTVPILENPLRWWQFATLAVIQELRNVDNCRYHWQSIFMGTNKSQKTMMSKRLMQSWYMKIYYRLIRFGIPKQLPNEPLSSNSGSSINAAAYEEMNSVGSNGLLSFTIPNILFKYYELPKPIRAAFQRLSLEGQQQSQLSPSEASMLLMLEDELLVEEILLYRDVVKRRIEIDGGNVRVGSETKTVNSSSWWWWFQRYDSGGQTQLKELSQWTGISQDEAKLVLEELYQMADKMSDDEDVPIVNESPVFYFSIDVGDLVLSAAGVLNVQAISLGMNMTNFATSGRSFTVALKKLHVNGIDGEQKPVVLLGGRMKEEKTLSTSKDKCDAEHVKQDQGLILSVRLRRSDQRQQQQEYSNENVSDVLERDLVNTLQKHQIRNRDIELEGVMDEIYLCLKESQLVPLASLIGKMHSVYSMGKISNIVPIPDNRGHEKLQNLIAGRKAYEKRGAEYLVSGGKRGMRSVHLNLKGVVTDLVLGTGDEALKISSYNKSSHRSLRLRVGRFSLRSGKHLIASELDKVATNLNHHVSNSTAVESWYARVEGLIASSDEFLSYNIMEPWGGEAFFSTCLIVGHPTIPNLQADFFLEPIVLNVTYGLMASIKTATEAYSNLMKRYLYHNHQSSSNLIGIRKTAPLQQPTSIDYSVLPRLELLSSLVKLQASFSISRFEIRVLHMTNDPLEKEKEYDCPFSSLSGRLKDCVTLLLSAYEQYAVDKKTTHRKYMNIGMDAAFQLFCQRCRAMLGGTFEDIDIKVVRDAVEMIHNDIMSGCGNMVGSKKDLAICAIVDMLVDSDLINQDDPGPGPQKVDDPYHPPLVVLCIWDWRVSLLQLVYDMRLDITAGGLNVVDGLGYTILSWSKVNSRKNHCSFGVGDMEEDLSTIGMNLKKDNRQDNNMQGIPEKQPIGRIRQRRNKNGSNCEDELKRVIQAAAASEAELSKQESALLCSIVIQDDKYIFGLGGVSLTSLMSSHVSTMPKMYGGMRLAAAEEVQPCLCKDQEVCLTLEGGLMYITIDPQSLELVYYCLTRFQGAVRLQTRKTTRTAPSPSPYPGSTHVRKKAAYYVTPTHQYNTPLNRKSPAAMPTVQEEVKGTNRSMKPVVKYTLVLNGTSTKILLAQRGMPFCCLNIDGLEVGADSNPNYATNGGRGPRMLVNGELKSVSFFDLTPDGSCHSQIIKTHREIPSLGWRLSKQATSLGEKHCLTFNQLPSGDLKIYTRGFNVCLTTRFSREISCYIGSYGVGPIIKQFIDNFSSGCDTKLSDGGGNSTMEEGSSSLLTPPLPLSSHEKKTVSSSSVNTTSTPSVESKSILIEAQDSILIVPRNSNSLELAAVHVECIRASIGWHQGSWQLPRDGMSVEQREHQRNKQQQVVSMAAASKSEESEESNEELPLVHTPLPSAHRYQSDTIRMGHPTAAVHPSGVVGRGDHVVTPSSSSHIYSLRDDSDSQILHHVPLHDHDDLVSNGISMREGWGEKKRTPPSSLGLLETEIFHDTSSEENDKSGIILPKLETEKKIQDEGYSIQSIHSPSAMHTPAYDFQASYDDAYGNSSITKGKDNSNNIPLDSEQVEGRESIATDEFYDAIDATAEDENSLIIDVEEYAQETLSPHHPVDDEECISASSIPCTTKKRLWGVNEDQDVNDDPHTLPRCRRVQVSLCGVCLSVALLPCIEQIPSLSAEGNIPYQMELEEENFEECFPPPLTWTVVNGGLVYESSPVCERSSTNKNNATVIRGAAQSSLPATIGEKDGSIREVEEPGRAYNVPYPSSSLLTWKQVTRELVDLELIVDVGRDIKHPRILLSMPEPPEQERSKMWSEGHRPNGLYADMSMPDYYLLLALYFDNYCELPTFFGKFGEGYYSIIPPTQWPEYGSPEMVDAVCNRLPLWEFAVTCPILEVLLSVDREYFPDGPPSSWMATENDGMNHYVSESLRSMWSIPGDDDDSTFSKALLPVAHVRAINSVVSISGGRGVIKVFVACGDMLVLDARDPVQTAHPCTFHAGMAAVPEPGIFQPWNSSLIIDPSKECMGYNVLDFGMRQHKGCIYKPQEQPVQTSVTLTTADQWCCVNVGVHAPDMCSKDFSIVWLIVDIFSWFHRDSKYGSPFYGYYPPPEERPIQFNPNSGILVTAPRSIDVHVWVTHPHLAMLETPLSKRTCASVVEMPTGVYYRWQWFSIPEIIHMELVIGSLAVVIVDDYFCPVKQRGTRGSAGSGRGVRTLLDRFSLSLTLNQWYSGNRIDLSVSVPADKREIKKQDTGLFGLNGPPLNIDIRKLAIPEPQAVEAVHGSSHVMGRCSGSLVASFEDVLYVMASMVVLVGPVKEDVEQYRYFRGGASIAPAMNKDYSSEYEVDNDGVSENEETAAYVAASTRTNGYGSSTALPAPPVTTYSGSTSVVLHMDDNVEEEDDEDDLMVVNGGGSNANNNILTASVNTPPVNKIFPGGSNEATSSATNYSIDALFEEDGGGNALYMQRQNNGGISEEEGQTESPYTFTIVIIITDLQVMVVDQVLGLHLPIFKFYIGSLTCFAENRLEEDDEMLESYLRGNNMVYSEEGNSKLSGQPQEQHQESGSSQDHEIRNTDGRQRIRSVHFSPCVTKSGGDGGGDHVEEDGGNVHSIRKVSVDSEGNFPQDMTTDVTSLIPQKVLAINGSVKMLPSVIYGGDPTLSERSRSNSNHLQKQLISLKRKTAMSIAVQSDVRVEYFNNLLKCWETMVEPFVGWIISDTCSYRGSGVMFHASCPFRMNISSALLNTLSDVSQRLDLLVPHLSFSYVQARISDLRRVHKDGRVHETSSLNDSGIDNKAKTNSELFSRISSPKGRHNVVQYQSPDRIENYGTYPELEVPATACTASTRLGGSKRAVVKCTAEQGMEIDKNENLIQAGGRRVTSTSSRQQHCRVGGGRFVYSPDYSRNNSSNEMVKEELGTKWHGSPVRSCRLPVSSSIDSESSGPMTLEGGDNADSLLTSLTTSPPSLLLQNYSKNRNHRFYTDKPVIRGSDAIVQSRSKEEENRLLITHQLCNSIPPDTRVAFSLLNSTGQEIRYFQPLKNDSTRCLQYLKTSTCGMLIFGATMTTIRNGKVEEVPFQEQVEVIAAGENNVTQPTIGPQEEEKVESVGTSPGHTFAVQVCGYRWLPCVFADHLGVRAFPLYPLIGRFSVHSLAPDPQIQMATSLIASVYPLNGGRQVCFRSCFRLLNGTDHPVGIVEDTSPSNIRSMHGTSPQQRGGVTTGYKTIQPGKMHHFPVTLLQRAVETSGGSSLGCFWVKPVRGIRARSFDSPQTVRLKKRENRRGQLEMGFCSVPVQLLHVVKQSQGLKGECISYKQVSCPAIHESMGKPRLPFSYCLEVRRREVKWETAGLVDDGPDVKLLANGPSNHKTSMETPSSPLSNFRKAASLAEGFRQRMSSFGGGLESPSKKEMGEKKNLRHGAVGGRQRRSKMGGDMHNNHVAFMYDIILYPPFVVENLLPHRAEFELIDQSQNLLWNSWLEPGESVGVHSIGTNEILLLLVNLEYARSNKGVIVHSGELDNDWSVNGSNKVGEMSHGSGPDYFSGGTNKMVDAVTNIVLTDTVGQKLQLNIENSIGGGSHRHVSVYCPFWLVNTSSHSLRFRQDGVSKFPAGTVSKLGDGSRPIFVDKSCFDVDNDMGVGKIPMQFSRASVDSSGFSGKGGLLGSPHHHSSIRMNHIFAGMPGPLRPRVNSESTNNSNYDENTPEISDCGIMASTPEALLKEELSLEELKQFACMFSFLDVVNDSSPRPIWGEKKLRVQVEDSMWSKAFSVDNIGMSQVLSVKSPQRGLYELGFSVTIPPGRLGQFTKMVQFWPRYVVVNEFEERTIKLVQNSSLRVAQEDVCSVRPCEQLPFDVPQVWGEKELRLSIGRGWGLSSSFPLDVAGDYTLRFCPYLDWHATSHVDTRGGPEYDEIIPAGVLELGIWFETDWYRRQLIVKNVKRGKYAYNHTDIQRGDVLLCVNGKSTVGLSFSVTMSIIRHSLQDAADTLDAAACAFLEEEEVGAQEDGKVFLFDQASVNKEDKPQISTTTPTTTPQFRHRIPLAKEVHPGTLLHFGTMEERYRLVRSKALQRNYRNAFQDDNNSNKETEHGVVPAGEVVPGECHTHSRFSKDLTQRKYSDINVWKNKQKWRELSIGKQQQPSLSGTNVVLQREKHKSGPYAASEEKFTQSEILQHQSFASSHDSSTVTSTIDINNLLPEDTIDTTVVEKDQEDMYVRVELRPIAASLMVVVSPIAPVQAPYIIENLDASHCIYFRQKNAVIHRWNRLEPGEKCYYTWEEPMGIRRLSVRVGPEYLTATVRSLNAPRGGLLNVQAEACSTLQHWGVGKVNSESEGTNSGGTKLIKLDGVGSEAKLPLPESEDKEGGGGGGSSGGDSVMKGNKPRQLHARVGAEGQNRILIISSHNNVRDTVASLRERVNILNKQNVMCHFVLDKYHHYTSIVSSLGLPTDDAIAKIVRRRSLACMVDPGTSLGPPPLVHDNNNPSSISGHPNTKKHRTEFRNSISGDGGRPSKREMGINNDVSLAHIRKLEMSMRTTFSNDTTLNDIDDAENRLWLDFGCGAVTGRNQLVVEVLEAKGLRQIDIGGTSSPYCILYLKIPHTVRHKAEVKQRAQTYYCEKTLNPKWIGQKFVFDVPQEAAHSKRGFRLRILILSRNPFKLNDFVGQADIPLSVLQDEQERHGWFPLTRRSSRFVHLGAVDQISGSIRLRVQWLQSTSSFLEYRIQELKGLLSSIKLRLTRTTQRVMHLEKEQFESIQKRRLGIHMNLSTTSSRRIRLWRNLLKIGPVQFWGSFNETNRFERPSMHSENSFQSSNRSQRTPLASESPASFLQGVKELNYSRHEYPEGNRVLRAHSLQFIGNQGSSFTDIVGDNSNKLWAVQHPSVLSQSNSSIDESSTGLNSRPLPRDEKCHKPSSSLSNCNHLLLSSNVSPHNLKMFLFKYKQNQASFTARVSQLNSFVREKQISDAAISKLLWARNEEGGRDRTIAECDEFEQHKPYSHLFLRRKSIKSIVSPCRQALICEVDLYHKHVLQVGGTIRLSPLKALNLSDISRRIFMVVTTRLQGGLFEWQSDRAQAAIQPYWDVRSKVCEFSVSAVDTNSIMTVEVFAEGGVAGVKSNVLLGSLHMRIASLIDCCVFKARSEYRRWFPLILPGEISRLEMLGEGGSVVGGGLSMAHNVSEQRSPADFNSRNPIVQLAVTWKPLTVPVTSHEPTPKRAAEGSTAMKHERTLSYMCTRFSEVGLGLVDSERPIELLRITGAGGDLCWSESAEYTRYSCMVETIQVDNQSKDAHGDSVVLAPTPVMLPYPALQVSAIQNNAKSHSKLQHFEYVCFLLQELDIRIEQRLVTDCVRFTITVLDYHRNRKKEGNAASNLSKLRRSSPLSTPVHTGAFHNCSLESANIHRFSKLSVGGSDVGSPRLQRPLDKEDVVNTGLFKGENDKESSTMESVVDESNRKVCLYIGTLQIHPVKLNMSFTKNSDSKEVFRVMRAQERRASTNREVEWGEQMPLQEISKMRNSDTVSYSIVSKFSRSLAEFAIHLTNDISPSPVRLNGMEICDFCKTQDQLILSLENHYFDALIRQLYKIVGSFDFLGDPVGVLSQLGTGIWDFFYEPAEGLMHSPYAFGRGVAKGTLSLVSNTASGVLGFTAKITRSMGGGIAVLSMDKDFQIKRIHRRVKGEQNLTEVGKLRAVGKRMLQAGKELGGGIYRGLSGVFVQPFRRGKERGIKGFGVGVFTGLTGLVTKPMVGCLDAVAHTGEAARTVAGTLLLHTKVLRSVKRRRLPQTFGCDGRLMPYSSSMARGAAILLKFPLSKDKHALSLAASTGPMPPSSPSLLQLSPASSEGTQGGKIFAGNPEMFDLFLRMRAEQRDFAIWTEMLFREPDRATIVVVSTTRVVVALAILDTKRSDLLIELDWTVLLESLVELPRLMDTAGGGSIIELCYHSAPESTFDPTFQRPESVPKITVRKIVGDYRVRQGLVRLYNVLSCLVQGRTNSVITTPRGYDVVGATPTFFASELHSWSRVIRYPRVLCFNGWEFGERAGTCESTHIPHHEDVLGASMIRRRALKNIWKPLCYSNGELILGTYLAFEMDSVQWKKFGAGNVNGEVIPNWASEVTGDSISAPFNIRRLMCESEPWNRDSQAVLNVKLDLRQGRLTANEFMLALDELVHNELLLDPLPTSSGTKQEFNTYIVTLSQSSSALKKGKEFVRKIKQGYSKVIRDMS